MTPKTPAASPEEVCVKIPKRGFVIAIDGPAGTGKSSVTKRLADVLAFVHVDTGAIYRAVALLSLERTRDRVKALEVAGDVASDSHFEFRRIAGKNPANRVLANGRDVTDFIRTPEMSTLASQVSAVPAVRAALLGLQRRLGCEGRSILEGRDIGTVVFPDADVKFFLTANTDERAKRRLAEYEALGADAPSFEEIKKQITARDHADSTRAIAPLKKAADAIELDTSPLTLDQVVETMTKLIAPKLALAASPAGGVDSGA